MGFFANCILQKLGELAHRSIRRPGSARGKDLELSDPEAGLERQMRFSTRKVKLLALDHGGQRGIAILENDPYFGDLFEIERRDGALIAIRKEIWQS